MTIKLTAPLNSDTARKLKMGQSVSISGKIYTGRDAAHKRLVSMIENSEDLPFDFSGQIIYYTGPTPDRPDGSIGSIGPTSSYRMDIYSPLLIDSGLKYMIGKGLRNKKVIDKIVESGGVYFAAIGGAGAIIRRSIVSSKIIAFDELGTEAIRELVVEGFPAIVAIDSNGNNIYSR